MAASTKWSVVGQKIGDVVNMSWAIFQRTWLWLLVVVLEFFNSRSCIQHWSVSRFSLARNTQISVTRKDRIKQITFQISRSSYQRCSIIKGVLRNFAKFIGKHLCQSLFFNKVADLEPCNFIKKETLAQVFSCAYCEISKNTFLSKHVFFPVAPSVQYYTLPLCSEKAHQSRKNI